MRARQRRDDLLVFNILVLFIRESQSVCLSKPVVPFQADSARLRLKPPFINNCWEHLKITQ